MYKFVAYSCMAAAVAYAAPSPAAEAEAWHGAGLGYGLGAVGAVGVAHAAPAVAVAPAVHTATVTTPKCTLTYEEIETQNCVPKAERKCDTKEVEQESVTYEKECKEVTSKVCGPQAGHIGIIKREAEADAWHGAGLGYGAGYGLGAVGAVGVAHAAAPAVVAAPAAVATSHVTIKSDCREVTKEVCVNTPKKITKTVPVTSCHVEQDVVCTPVVKRIPKKNCEAVETKVAVPVAAPVAVAHAAPVAGLAAGHLW